MSSQYSTNVKGVHNIQQMSCALQYSANVTYIQQMLPWLHEFKFSLSTIFTKYCKQHTASKSTVAVKSLSVEVENLFHIIHFTLSFMMQV